jgi:hypothetical protein
MTGLSSGYIIKKVITASSGITFAMGSENYKAVTTVEYEEMQQTIITAIKTLVKYLYTSI